MGSKSRIAKYIVPILQKTINDNNVTTFYDIFCGGCNIIDKVHAEKRIAVDSNPYLIALWKHVQADLPLLDAVDRELYNNVKRELETDVYSDWIKGNVGFLASYNGKFFDGGYAKPGIGKTKYGERKRDYYDEARRNILKQKDLIKDIEFICADYASIEPKNAVIYYDPPYQRKTGYKNSKDFDYDKFWEVIRQWSKDNWVFVSEESAPDDMTCIWEQEVSRSLNPKNKTKVTEKLFIYEGE